MDATQIQQRDHFMQQLWAVEDSGISPESPELKAAAQFAVEQMRALLQTVESESDPLEIGRSWRYLGDCYFALSAKKDQEALEKGREAYLHAESYLEGCGDLLELGKMSFNLANTSRLIDGGYNRELMQEAKRRYYEALLVFREHMPQGVPQVESSLQSLETGLRALDMYAHAKEGHERTTELRRRLEEAGSDPSPDLLAEIRNELDDSQFGKDDALAQIQEIRNFIDTAGSLLVTSPEQEAQWESYRKQFDKMAQDSIFGESESIHWENNMFDLVFEKLKEASDRGEVTPQRREALSSTLTDFRKLYRQRPSTPEEMVARVGLMRILIKRYKSITDSSKTFGA